MMLDNVERMSSPAADVLLRDYIRPGRPVILTDLFDRQPIRAVDTPDAARRQIGDVVLQVQPNYVGALLAHGRTAEPRPITVAEFLDLLTARSDTDLYCVEYPTPAGILDRVGRPEACDLREGADVISTMFFAGKGNSAHLHFDGDLRDVIMYQALGTKRYVIIDPRETRKLDPFVDAGIERTSSVFLENFSESDKTAFLRYTNAWDCVLSPGEALLMPMMAWHYVEYLEPSMSVSFRLGRNRYCRFLAEQMPMRSIFLQALAVRFADETALAAEDLAIFEEIESACRQPYPSEAARRRHLDRLCLEIWERTAPADQRLPYTVRDMRRIDGIRAVSPEPPAAPGPWEEHDVPALAPAVRVLSGKDTVVFARGSALEAEFPLNPQTAWVAKMLSALGGGRTIAALQAELAVDGAALTSVLGQFQQRGWVGRVPPGTTSSTGPEA
jgi:lysine-specific demethylase 8